MAVVRLAAAHSPNPGGRKLPAIRKAGAIKEGRSSDARERILDAAWRLFADHPYAEISAASIAKEAGVAHGLMFHYFGSKNRLYEDICKLVAERIEKLQLSAVREGDTEQRLRSFLSTHMDEVGRHRKSYVHYTRGGGTKEVQEIWEKSRRKSILILLDVLGAENPSNELIVTMRCWLGLKGPWGDCGEITKWNQAVAPPPASDSSGQQELFGTDGRESCFPVVQLS